MCAADARSLAIAKFLFIYVFMFFYVMLIANLQGSAIEVVMCRLFGGCLLMTHSLNLLLPLSIVKFGYTFTCIVRLTQGLVEVHSTFLIVINNHLNGTLKPQSNGPLYSNTEISTLAVDGCAVTLGTARRVLGAAPPSPLLAVPNVTAHPSTASVPTSYYSMWHCKYHCTLKS